MDQKYTRMMNEALYSLPPKEWSRNFCNWNHMSLKNDEVRLYEDYVMVSQVSW
jgi:hypothetical protein